MRRPDLNDLAAFSAAAQLGVSQSALSQTLRQLEARLGVRLLTRSTRSVATTEAGERLLRAVGPALDDIDAGLGLAYLPEEITQPFIAAGRLVRVLGAWCQP